MADKDYPDMLDEILPLAKEVLCVTPDNPRALSAVDLAKIIQEKGVPAIVNDTVGGAVDKAFERASKDDVIVALGSLYMIGDIKKYKKKNY
jgi:dihydrofolate synthase/folylpolyglutamate synthase